MSSNPLQFYKRAKKQYETNRPLGYEFSLTKADNKCKKFMIILGKFIEVFKSGMRENYKYEIQETDNYWQELEKHFGDLVELKYILNRIYEGKEVKLRLLFMLLLNTKKLFQFMAAVIHRLPHLYINANEKLKSLDGELEPVAFFRDGHFKIFTVTPNYIEQFKSFWEEEQTKKLLFAKQIKEIVNELVERVEKGELERQEREERERNQRQEKIQRLRLKQQAQKQQIQRDRKERERQQALFRENRNVNPTVQPEFNMVKPAKQETRTPQPAKDLPQFVTVFPPFQKSSNRQTPETPDQHQALQKKPKHMKNSQYLYQIRYKDELQSYENNTHPYNFEFTISQNKSKCTECGKELSRGLIIMGSDINLCNYSGKWFCNDCMANQRIQIPHKAKYDFDLRSYQVSKQAYERIRFYYERTIIEFRHDEGVVLEHRKLYDFLVLKRQLHLMYDSICNPDFMNKTFGKKINYALKRNLFSLKNLYDVYNGHQYEQIQKDFGILQRHFYKCEICQSRKGRLCSSCANPPKIFAFELKETYSCKHCQKIYHRRCLIGNRCACETSTLR